MTDNNNQNPAAKELSPAEATAKGETFKGASPAGKQFPLRSEAEGSSTNHNNGPVAKPVDSVKLNNRDFSGTNALFEKRPSHKSGSTDKVTDNVQTDPGGTVNGPMKQFPLRKGE